MPASQPPGARAADDAGLERDRLFTGLAAALTAGRTLVIPYAPTGARSRPGDAGVPATALWSAIPAASLDLVVLTTPVDAMPPADAWLAEARRVLAETGMLLCVTRAVTSSMQESEEFLARLRAAFPFVACRLGPAPRPPQPAGEAATPGALLAWIGLASASPLDPRVLWELGHHTRPVLVSEMEDARLIPLAHRVREARLTDLEIDLHRTDARIALALARWMGRVNRGLGGGPLRWWRRRRAARRAGAPLAPPDGASAGLPDAPGAPAAAPPEASGSPASPTVETESRAADDERAARLAAIQGGGWSEPVSIVVLSLNRPDATARCLDALERHTPLPHEVIVVDNGSTPGTLERLRRRASGARNVRLHEAGRNHGVGGGRNIGACEARGRYVVFLDNDIEVTAGWLEPLLVELELDPLVAGCCCRVLFPDRIIQFTGGVVRAGLERMVFELGDEGRGAGDPGTFRARECDWIPGGATIMRRDVLLRFPYDAGMIGAFEDNDWSLVVRKAGYRLVNAPGAVVIHHHAMYESGARDDRHYWEQRNDPQRLRASLVRFYRKHGFAIDDDPLYRELGYEGTSGFIAAMRAGDRAAGNDAAAGAAAGSAR